MKQAIRYFSFWDVPRTFIFQREGKIYLLESEFDDTLDDYPDQYDVFVLDTGATFTGLTDWKLISPLPRTHLGKVPVSSVHFDKSIRKFVDDCFLSHVSVNPVTPY